MSRVVVLLVLCCAGIANAQVQHFADPTKGIELHLEYDQESDDAYLWMQRIDADGRGQLLVQPFALQLAVDGRLSGEGLNRGQRVRVSVRPSDNGASLDWLAPKSLAGLLGQPLAMAETYPAQSKQQRLADAKRQFLRADKALNLAYGQLRKRMATEDFVELRANQRRWLKYRDWFVADGDDTDLYGPGTVSHIQLQTERTLDRVAFLNGLAKPRTEPALSGLYSDGIDRELRLREVPTVDRHVFLSLRSALPQLHDRQYDEPITLAGRASPVDGDNVWAADQSSLSPNVVVRSELSIEPAADFESVLIATADQSLFADRLYFVAELKPAREPMREILLRLPAAIYDHTTEGLSERAKTPLLLDGYYEPFRLGELGMDHAHMTYAEGQVNVHRFPLANDEALVAVATQNVRARHFELWRIGSGALAPGKVNRNTYLPEFQAGDFYLDDSDAKLSQSGLLTFELRADIEEIGVRWQAPMDAPEPDYQFDLYWDGFGFGRVRSDASF